MLLSIPEEVSRRRAQGWRAGGGERRAAGWGGCSGHLDRGTRSHLRRPHHSIVRAARRREHPAHFHTPDWAVCPSLSLLKRFLLHECTKVHSGRKARTAPVSRTNAETREGW